MPKLPRSTSNATSSMASGTIPSRPAKPHPDRLKIMHLFPDRPIAVANGVRVTRHLLDVADREAVAAFPGVVAAVHPRVDLLVNNAGVALGGTVEEVSE